MRSLLLALILTGCAAGTAPQMIPGAPPPGPYRLVALDGVAFAYPATLTFGADGTLYGEGPCNLWRARQVGAVPQLRVVSLTLTERACVDKRAMQAETDFIGALAQITRAQFDGRALTLTGPDRALRLTRDE